MRKLILAFALIAVLIAGGCIGGGGGTTTTTEKTVTVGYSTVHYSGDVSLTEAKNLASFLQNEFDFKNDTDIFLEKSGGKYMVSITSTYRSGNEIEQSVRFYLQFVASRISQDVFGGEPVVLKVISQAKKELLSIESKYKYVQSGEVRVYYRGVTADEAKKVADYLVSIVGESYEWDLIMEKNNQQYDVTAVSGFKSADQITDNMKKAYQSVATELKDMLGGDVILHVVDIGGNELINFKG
ncbi:hypothetical protein [Thermococcus sp.]